MADKTKEQLFQEREKRLSDTIQLKVPDRVPIEMSFGYFPAKYAGVTCKPSYYDFDTWLEATRKTILDFEPDALCHGGSREWPFYTASRYVTLFSAFTVFPIAYCPGTGWIYS